LNNLNTIGLKGWLYMTDRERNARETVSSGKIEIPAEFASIAANWHGGQASMLYAVASTGSLSRGSIRPQVRDYDTGAGRQADDAEWIHGLAETLSSELSDCLHMIDMGNDIDGDRDTIVRFKNYIDEIAGAIEDHILPV
jgi:hypothetical protein